MFGLSEGTTKFLASLATVICFAILAHSQAVITDGIVGRKLFLSTGMSLVERDRDLPVIDRFHSIVDDFHIVSLIRKERAFLQRDCLVGCGQDVGGNGGVGNVGRRSQFV